MCDQAQILARKAASAEGRNATADRSGSASTASPAAVAGKGTQSKELNTQPISGSKRDDSGPATPGKADGGEPAKAGPSPTQAAERAPGSLQTSAKETKDCSVPAEQAPAGPSTPVKRPLQQELPGAC